MLQVALKIYDEERWVTLIWLMIGTNVGLFNTVMKFCKTEETFDMLRKY